MRVYDKSINGEGKEIFHIHLNKNEFKVIIRVCQLLKRQTPKGVDDIPLRGTLDSIIKACPDDLFKKNFTKEQI